MAPDIHPAPDLIIHASCASLQGRAVLITGPSGSGKSSLALELMSRGAALVADDRTCLRTAPRGLIAYAPQSLLGIVEARGLGLLRAEPSAPCRVHLVIDLGQQEGERMPPPRTCDILGCSLPLLHDPQTPSFAAMVSQYLRCGPWTET